MGYSVWQEHIKFGMSVTEEDEALAAVKEWDRSAGGRPTPDIQQAVDLSGVFEFFGFSVDRDSEGSIDGLVFEGDKIGPGFEDLGSVLHIVAPFVVAGSVIQLRGEEGEPIAWSFDSGRCASFDPEEPSERSPEPGLFDEFDQPEGNDEDEAWED